MEREIIERHWTERQERGRREREGEIRISLASYPVFRGRSVHVHKAGYVAGGDCSIPDVRV